MTQQSISLVLMKMPTHVVTYATHAQGLYDKLVGNELGVPVGEATPGDCDLTVPTKCIFLSHAEGSPQSGRSASTSCCAC